MEGLTGTMLSDVLQNQISLAIAQIIWQMDTTVHICYCCKATKVKQVCRSLSTCHQNYYLSNNIVALTHQWGAAARDTPCNGCPFTCMQLWLSLTSWCQVVVTNPCKSRSACIQRAMNSCFWTGWIPEVGVCCHSRAFDRFIPTTINFLNNKLFMSANDGGL